MNVHNVVSIILTFLLIETIDNVSEDLFSSITGLEVLIKTREEVIKYLETLVDNEETDYSIIKRYVKRYTEDNKLAMLNVNDYIANPINAYILIKSLTSDLKIIEKREGIVIPKHNALVYPSQEDLMGAVRSLKQLQRVYELDVSRLADGELLGNLSSSLTAGDCYELGQMLLLQEYSPELAMGWLRVALRKYTEEDEVFGFHQQDVMRKISDAYLALGDRENAMMWSKRRKNWKNGDAINFADDDYSLARIMMEAEKRASESGTLIEDYTTYKALFDRYHSLCRGEHKISPYVANRLKCMYFSATHPFLRLAPLKMEILHNNPGIYLVHDVINDEEIQHLKTLATPSLARAQVSSGASKSGPRQTHHRVNKLAWIRHHHSLIIPRLARRVADFTGLRHDDEEPLQIANYGIGGYYWPHYDYYTTVGNVLQEKPRGNRLASVIFYLSEVPLGGATVFLEAGVTVFPVKGSALFWMNLHPSCDNNKATLHAACPVLLGSKWVGVLWKHQLGNELLKPCGLTPSSSSQNASLLDLIDQ